MLLGWGTGQLICIEEMSGLVWTQYAGRKKIQNETFLLSGKKPGNEGKMAHSSHINTKQSGNECKGST